MLLLLLLCPSISGLRVKITCHSSAFSFDKLYFLQYKLDFFKLGWSIDVVGEVGLWVNVARIVKTKDSPKDPNWESLPPERSLVALRLRGFSA